MSVPLVPAPHSEPYAQLEPLVAALLARGAQLTRRGVDASPFWSTPEGYIAVLDRPIDWEYLTTHFQLPPTIRYDERRDVVLDDANWTAVYGSSGRRANG